MVQWIKEYGSKVIKKLVRPKVDATLKSLSQKYKFDYKPGEGQKTLKQIKEDMMKKIKSNPGSTSKGRDALMGDLTTRRQLMTK